MRKTIFSDTGKVILLCDIYCSYELLYYSASNSRLLLKSFLISGISISVTLQQCKAIINLNKAILIAGRTKKNNESLLENVTFRIFLLSDVLTRKYNSKINIITIFFKIIVSNKVTLFSLGIVLLHKI